ncbi:FGGY family carbohydrate kinase [Chloroflexus sp.]|uniref:FGGY family carbohydrate kinase n=1 Tax=Chloroflexus sp. TaxID=1904827 RepID=UPI002606C647|nr:FGGY family carbohydrate kinase [uncultured Chloroflexus sp.]
MTGRYILAIDQGGSGSRAVIYDDEGQVRGYGYRAVGRVSPQPGWVEQRPALVARSVAIAINEALAKAGARGRDLLACGITSQRDTVFAWHARTGRPIGNAITWQDLRAAPLVAALDETPLAPQRRERLGQFPGAYAGAMHMAWRMQHDAAFRRAAERGELRVSLAAGWIVQALGRPAEHALDHSLLQAMTVYDPRRRALWDEWIDALRIPRAALPVARSTIHHFGELHLDGAAVPVLAMMTDQQAALFGYDCRLPGQAVATHGTASFVNVVAGSVAPPQGICKTYLAWELDGMPTYAMEADMTTTGAAANWLREIGLVSRVADLDRQARQVSNSGGVVFVPALNGLGVPSEDRSARGAIFGLALGVKVGHIARAFYESIGFQLFDILATMRSEAGLSITELRVGGGLAASDLACQIQADLSGVTLVRARDTETTARGVALLAGIGAGVWSLTSLPELIDDNAVRFTPAITDEERVVRHARWQQAVDRAKGWVK